MIYSADAESSLSVTQLKALYKLHLKKIKEDTLDRKEIFTMREICLLFFLYK